MSASGQRISRQFIKQQRPSYRDWTSKRALRTKHIVAWRKGDILLLWAGTLMCGHRDTMRSTVPRPYLARLIIDECVSLNPRKPRYFMLEYVLIQPRYRLIEV